MNLIESWLIITAIVWGIIVLVCVLDKIALFGGYNGPTLNQSFAKHKYKILLGILFWPITMIVYPFIYWNKSE